MSDRTVTLGNGQLFLVLDAAGQARDLYHPRAGFPNHLDAGACDIGIQVADSDSTVWIDDSWAAAQSVDADGRGAKTVLKMPHGPISITLTDRLGLDVNCWRRAIEVVAQGSRSIRLILHHDLRLNGTDVGACVRHHPPTHITHFNRNQHCEILIEGGQVDDWTLGRADECDGSGIKGRLTQGPLDQNRVAMGATESLLAHTLELSDDQVACITLRFAMGATNIEAHAAASAPISVFDRTKSREFSTSIPDEFKGLAATSMAVLLAHVDSGGGLVAGLDGSQTCSSRDGYSYVWMRDAALIADVLARSGHSEVVDQLIQFAIRVMSPEGWLGQRHHPDGSAGSTWHPEHLPNSTHLPIQTDETALCIWMATRHIERGHGGADTQEIFDQLIRPMAQFLCSYRDPTSGLPLPSHDLWEERWGIHTFTAVVTAEALRRAAAIAERLGHASDDQESWATAAVGMKAAIRTQLFHEDLGRFARCATIEPDDGLYLDTTPDASLLLAALLSSDEELEDESWSSTIESVSAAIAVDEVAGGMARYVGDHYARSPRLPKETPGNPWPMVTCWLSEIHSRRGQSSSAINLLQGVASMTTDSGTLPEQLDPSTRLPCSITPLPWSHAAFLSSLYRLNS